MRMRQQLIIAVAVVFATVAVGVNVFASTRATDQHSRQLDRVMPVGSVSSIFRHPPTGPTISPLPTTPTPPTIRAHVQIRVAATRRTPRA